MIDNSKGKTVNPAIVEHMAMENEKLRGLLRLATDRWESWASEIINTTPEYESELAEIARIRAALSQQADPVEPTLAQNDLRSRCAEILEWQNTGVLPGDALRAFAASQPYAADRNHLQMAEADTARQAYRFVVRSGQAEPAPAQDEREAFEAWRLEKFCGGTERLKKCSNAPDVYYYAAEQEAWKTWRAALATRPAQTEQQPVAVPEDFQPLETIRWWISAYTNPENGPSYQGHGMMVQMLCEYEALRIMLSSRAQQRPTAYPHEAMDKLAADRYRVGAAGAGTLHGFAVRAGDGEQELYRGSKSDCEHVARKLAGAFLDGGFTAFERYAAPIAQTAPQGKFRMGDLVKKSTGSEWEGRVVGWYSTEQTKEGYAVESSAHRNSVQIYPVTALEAVE